MATKNVSFGRVLKGISGGKKLEPLIHNALSDPQHKAFQMKIRPGKGSARKPDGWFHPSTHPLWTERQLYYYLAFPELMVKEPFDYLGTMATTGGLFWHEFMQSILTDAGVLKETEAYVEDPESGSRGSMDGILVFDEAWEFKCVVPQTRIHMSGGGWKRASEIEAGDQVWGWDDRVVEAKVASVQDNGIKTVLWVTTKQGRKIGVTEEHPFLTERGWVSAVNLVAGDQIKVAFDIPNGHVEDLDKDDAWLLGCIIGDGGCSQTARSQLTFSNIDTLILSEMDRILLKKGCRLRQTPSMAKADHRIVSITRGSPNSMIGWIVEQGMGGKYSWNKEIPPSVWRGGSAAWIHFLSGYLDTDGSVSNYSYHNPTISWSSVNRDLLIDCQTMLAYLGIQSTVQYHSQYKDRSSWTLFIRDGVSVRRAQSILLPRGDKGRRLREVVTKSQIKHHSNAILGWDMVKTIERGIDQPTIAIEVDGVHTHVTEGLISHNTMNGLKMKKFTELGPPDSPELLAVFKDKCPVYWAQAQEYLRMSGFTTMRFTIMEAAYPFTLAEIAVPYTPQDALPIRDKYMNVRQMVADQVLPQPCCIPGSKDAKACVARDVCPIGQMS